MKLLRSRRGYTLMETMASLSITALISAGALVMMVAALSCYDTTSAQAFTDTDATIAMQMIVNDVREAKSITVTGGNVLSVVFPLKASGYYDRHSADPASQTNYYLSNSSGAQNRTGSDCTWLWKQVINHDPTIVKRDVTSIAFVPDTSRSVKITIITQTNTSKGPQTTELTQRVVYLRNY